MIRLEKLILNLLFVAFSRIKIQKLLHILDFLVQWIQNGKQKIWICISQELTQIVLESRHPSLIKIQKSMMEH